MRAGKDMSLAWAEFVSYWGNWVLIITLVIGVAATYAVVVSGTVKEDALKKELADRAADAAHTEWQISLLKLDAKQLEADTALANERAVKARLELERYRAPRDLSEGELEALAAELERFPGIEFVLTGYPDVAESTQFVDRLAIGLEKAGWKRRDVPLNLAAGTAGVWIDWYGGNPNAPKDAAEALAGALRNMGITAVTRDEREYPYFWNPRNSNVIGIEVGTKH